MEPSREPNTAVARGSPLYWLETGVILLTRALSRRASSFSSGAPIVGSGFAALLTPIPIFLHSSKCAGCACTRLPCGKRQVLASRAAYFAWPPIFKSSWFSSSYKVLPLQLTPTLRTIFELAVELISQRVCGDL